VLYFGTPVEEMEMEEKETKMKDFIEYLSEDLSYVVNMATSLRQLRFPPRLKRGPPHPRVSSYQAARIARRN
jgi:hypothetical protein